MSNKPKFLFIHGAGGTSNKWRKLPNVFLEDPASIIDLPGRTKGNNHPFTSIEQVASILDDRIQEDVIVVGHSMGGLIGIELAARNEFVKGLILVNSHYQTPVDSNVLTKLQNGSFPKGLFYASYSKDADKKLLIEEEKDNQRVSVNTTYYDFLACNKYKNGKVQLSSLAIPILAILGEEDRLLPNTVSEELLETKPEVEIEIVKGVGHFVMLENPEVFHKVLRDFRKNFYNER